MMRPAAGGVAADSLAVVVVDDEADVAAYLSAVLERSGHRSGLSSDPSTWSY